MGTSGLRVHEYMTSPATKVDTNAKLQSIHEVLERERISAVGVTDSAGKLVGVVSRSDLLRVGKSGHLSGQRRALAQLPDAVASEVMARDPLTVAPDATLGSAGKLFLKHRVHRVFVEQDGDCMGVLSTSDVMRAICEDTHTEPISAFATKGVVQVRESDSVSLALDRMQAAHVHGIVVVDRGWPIGIFAQPEALAARGAAPETPVSEYLNPRFLVLPDEMLAHRAAGQAVATRVRRVVLSDGESLSGILSGPDFVKALT